MVIPILNEDVPRKVAEIVDMRCRDFITYTLRQGMSLPLDLQKLVRSSYLQGFCDARQGENRQ